MSRAHETLAALGLDELNAGAWSGSHGWSPLDSGPVIDSLNPTTGLRLARVRGATPADYEHVLGAAVEAAQQWRLVPAPQRGEVIAHPDGFDFEITDADPRRIKRVRVRPHPPALAEAETPAPSKPDGQ